MQRDQATKHLMDFAEAGAALTDIHTLKLNEQGLPTENNLSKGLVFNFEYMRFLFAVWADADENNKGCLVRIHAHLGALPYSAQSVDNRANASAILMAANRTLKGPLLLTI